VGSETEDRTLARLQGEGGTPHRAEVATLIAYGDQPDQVVELHEPPRPTSPDPARAQPEPPRTLVVVHGGYFRPAVDRTHARPMARALAAAGWRVALAEYRRVPGDPEATTADLTALDARLRADGHDTAAWVGHSAGGTLVLWRGLTPTLPGTPVVALAPVADLSAAVHERLGNDAVRDWIGATPAEAPDLYARLDSLRLREDRAARAADGVAAQGITVLHGDADASVPLRQSQAWERAVLAGADHFDLIDPTSPHWPAVVDAIRRSAAPRRP
jgi:acetyl esterase/lipase